MVDVGTGIGMAGKTVVAIKNTASFLAESYQKRQKKRVQLFFECIELRYADADPELIAQLNAHLESEEGQELLASFADSITQTSCARVHMALAMLMCNDPEHQFNDSERYTFVCAMIGATDELIDFFLDAAALEKTSEGYLYPRACISSGNCEKFKRNRWDDEAIFVYVNDLIRLRLLLPDPLTAPTIHGSNNDWALWFGITDRTMKMANLLRKAGELLKFANQDTKD
ncbi:hypothetical protein [Vibrio coralliilyticus]|uniref:hypothetical protein n=1 Tax=Vibrio coralliilyticus TaxID=190893 RepID=UPI0002F4ADAC|nr:hypothetical protein [Vibrio coralliilyticus]